MKQIFVFGSNLKGVHGAGAAKYAYEKLGAQWGVGEGLTGLSYALPTKDMNIKTRSMTDIQNSVVQFLAHVIWNPDCLYRVSPIGCGLAGLKKRDVARMFMNNYIPNNVVFNREWFNGK